MSSSKVTKAEFGDFQTPLWFAREICAFLASLGIEPASIVEPTCGLGNFLLAALDQFGSAQTAVGAEINPTYIELLKKQIASRTDQDKVKVIEADFFFTNWQEILISLPDPLLIIGNPPWATNTELSSIGSRNLPPKSNFQNYSGIEAITGASNFDISEWMLLKIFEWLKYRQGVIAILCKTAVARKLLRHTWQNPAQPGNASIHLIEAQQVFHTAVAACLLILDTRETTHSQSCPVYYGLSSNSLLTQIGYRDGQLIANVEFYERWQRLQCADGVHYKWRSGIKHDCAQVMEFEKVGNLYKNKLHKSYELESTYLYPMLKSSDVAKPFPVPSRWMLVTQHSVNDNTLTISHTAPRTWAYLKEHGHLLDSRKSEIYKKRPRFSIFGVGNYTFSPWKVAVSGLYKKLDFVVIGPYEDEPVVLDDTCYFLPCQSETEAHFIASLLNSEPAQQFYQAFIFWDAKRPVTAKVLGRLNLLALAKELGQEWLPARDSEIVRDSHAKQLMLLEKRAEYHERQNKPSQP